jgi:hypothetical protein
MTAFEFESCRQLAEKWWPGISWTLDRDTIRDFDRISLTAGRKAIDQLKDEPSDRYPSLAKYLRACKSAQGALPRVAETPETCTHRWGVLSEWEQRLARERESKPEGSRLAVCAVCHTELWGEHRTVGESEGVKETAA